MLVLKKYVKKYFNLITRIELKLRLLKKLHYTHIKFNRNKETIIVFSQYYLKNNTSHDYIENIETILNEKYNVIRYIYENEYDIQAYRYSFLIVKDDNKIEKKQLLSHIHKKYNVKILVLCSIDSSILEVACSLNLATLLISDFSNANYNIMDIQKSVIMSDKVILPDTAIFNKLLKQIENLVPCPSLISNIHADCSELFYKKIKYEGALSKIFLKHMSDSIIINSENIEIQSFLVSSDVFDSDFMNIISSKSQSAYYYIKTQRKGFYKACPNPAPGFSTSIWICENEAKGLVPLYKSIKNGYKTTHRCMILGSNHLTETKKRSFKNKKIAIHLHLYYTDLAKEFCEYFKNISVSYDLYITTTSSVKNPDIKEAFLECGAENIEVFNVENRGRDIAPLIFDLKDEIIGGKYEIVGHFHSKKSVAIDGNVGDKWRKYLLDSLIGNNSIFTNSVLELFNNENTGLIFPEPKDFIDIGANKEYINSLCEILKIKKINQTPIFPVGNMYWARVDAIRDLFYLEKEKVIQNEPLPTDGSYMHAIERIMPHIAHKNNYSFVTVYKKDIIN
ncbi:rhamnan synthesis F family protein [Francisella philomiragia]|uniref:rhamnan synthesis F family protein n=1 Tax=Francisella philomiragia TaxID=28110 RepID=UPI001C9D8DAF|nr:rhamnan synthesis F family protein [Francisella philomiragia]MBY7734778.1 rhamnan synthesis F family protein [Francisella philomiragia]